MRTRLLLLSLVACAPDPGLADGASPPPMTLSTPTLIPGQPFTLTVSGATPGDRVWFGRGGGLGCCTCPPSMGGACLGVTGPLPLSSGRADVAGVLTRTWTLPATVPVGTRVAFQAAVVAGAASYVSDPVEVVVQPADPLTLLDDPFDGAALTGWSSLNDALFNRGVAGGQLITEAVARSSWVDAGDGPLLYKVLSGDFIATTVAWAEDPLTGQEPRQLRQQAGLMVHHLNPNTDGHVYVAVGNDDAGLSVEAATTRRSASTASRVDWAETGAELRLCRYGTMMRAYRRPIGASVWELAGEWARLDLLGDVLVGPMLMADQAAPALRAVFEEVRFATPADALECGMDR